MCGEALVTAGSGGKQVRSQTAKSASLKSPVPRPKQHKKHATGVASPVHSCGADQVQRPARHLLPSVQSAFDAQGGRHAAPLGFMTQVRPCAAQS